MVAGCVVGSPVLLLSAAAEAGLELRGQCPTFPENNFNTGLDKRAVQECIQEGLEAGVATE